MINDLLDITLDKYFRPINDMPRHDIKNQFELLYSDNRKINQRRSFGCSLYPNFEFANEYSPIIPSVILYNKI